MSHVAPPRWSTRSSEWLTNCCFFFLQLQRFQHSRSHWRSYLHRPSLSGKGGTTCTLAWSFPRSLRFQNIWKSSDQLGQRVHKNSQPWGTMAPPVQFPPSTSTSLRSPRQTSRALRFSGNSTTRRALWPDGRHCLLAQTTSCRYIVMNLGIVAKRCF